VRVAGAERGARRDQDDAAEAALAHAGQQRLHQLDRRAEMQLDERVEVGERTSASSAGRMTPALWTRVVGACAAGHLGGDPSRRFAVGEVDLDRCSCGCAKVGGAGRARRRAGPRRAGSRRSPGRCRRCRP
jgi:hypothetical protein